jgi:hypothetical protein
MSYARPPERNNSSANEPVGDDSSADFPERHYEWLLHIVVWRGHLPK